LRDWNGFRGFPGFVAIELAKLGLNYLCEEKRNIYNEGSAWEKED